MPNMLNEPQRPFIPQPRGPERLGRAVGDLVRAGLVIAGWLVLAAVGIVASYVVIRVSLWAAREILTALGV